MASAAWMCLIQESSAKSDRLTCASIDCSISSCADLDDSSAFNFVDLNMIKFYIKENNRMYKLFEVGSSIQRGTKILRIIIILYKYDSNIMT